MPIQNQIKFFLGSNTKRGFVPLFEQLRDPINGYRLYILKGGPGSGKSTLMRRIAKTLEAHGEQIEYIPCASDPQSLDAILDYGTGTAVVDGTAPHTLDPKYPGAYDTIINLGDAWDQNMLLNNKNRIIELTDRITQYHSMATTCITAAALSLDHNKTIAKNYVHYDVIQEYIEQLSKELKDSPPGQERKRLLSAVSVGNTVFYDSTLTTLCPKLYVISDDWGAASEMLLSSLHDFALTHKLDVITCYCSIQTPDKIEHLIFPSAQIGITTSNFFHATRCNTSTAVEGLMQPIDTIDLNTMINNLTTAQQLLGTACGHIKSSKLLHDELEAFYITAMDFSKLDGIYDKIINEILLHR